LYSLLRHTRCSLQASVSAFDCTNSPRALDQLRGGGNSRRTWRSAGLQKQHQPGCPYAGGRR